MNKFVVYFLAMAWNWFIWSTIIEMIVDKNASPLWVALGLILTLFIEIPEFKK